MRHFLLAEAAGSHGVAPAIAAAIAVAANGDPVAKPRAGDRALHAFRAAGAVPVTWALRHVEGAGVGGDQVRARLAFTLESIGIAEAAGLNFLGRDVERWDGRTPGGKTTCMNQLRTRSPGNLLEFGRLEIV